MASENTIRKRAKEQLTEDGWIISMPKRQRYGSTTTTLPEGETFENDKQYKGHDDIFSLFDGIAWRKGEMKLIQWTGAGHNNVKFRAEKIKDFMKEWQLECPKGVSFEVWGYENGKGFIEVEEIK